MTKAEEHKKYTDNVNGWGFVPIGYGRIQRTRTGSNHYFYHSDKSLCGIIKLNDQMKHDYRFTKSKNIMNHLLCHICIGAVRSRNRTIQYQQKLNL